MARFTEFLSSFISTFFYIGKVPIMPGTFGTIAGMLLILFIFYQPHGFDLSGGELYFAVGSGFIPPHLIIYVMVILSCLFYVIGQVTSQIYSDIWKKKDPKEVVIDEVAGIFTAVTISSLIYAVLLEYDRGEYLVYISLSGYFFLGHFILFRIYDIIKPWPTNYFEKKYKGGFGIMIDDQIAAIQAVITFYLLFYLLKYTGYLDSFIAIE